MTTADPKMFKIQLVVPERKKQNRRKKDAGGKMWQKANQFAFEKAIERV